MGHITGSDTFVLDNATTQVVNIPPTATGDVVFLGICCYATATISSITGNNGGTWNLEVDASAAADDAFVYSCVQAATPDTTVTVVFSASERAVFSVMNTRGVDTTTPIEASAVNTGSVNRDITMPSVTASANSIIWRLCGTRTYPSRAAAGNTYRGTAETSSNLQFMSSCTQTQVSSGATGTETWHHLTIYGAGSYAVTAITMSIKDDGTGDIEPDLDLSTVPYSYLLPLSRYDGGFIRGAWYDPTSASYENISSLSNGSYTTTDLHSKESGAINGGIKDGFRSVLVSNTSTSYLDHVILTGYPITETYNTVDNYDLSGKLIAVSNKSSDPRVHKDSDIGSCIAISDQTNARFWQLGTANSVPSLNDGVYPTVIDVDDTTFVMDTIGTPNTASIGALIVGGEHTATSINILFSPVWILGELTLQGGSATVPASFETYNKNSVSCMLNTVLNNGGLSTGQYLVLQDTKSGSSQVVYWDCSNQSAEWPSQYDADVRKRNFKFGAGVLTHTIGGVAGSTIIYDAATLNFGNYHNLVIDSDVAISSDGLTVLNADVVITDNASTALGGISFIGCKEITLNGNAMSGGISFTGGVDTNAVEPLNGATQAALQLLVDDLANSTFSNNNTAIRIEYTGTGDITLNFDNITVSGNTVDLHYNATSSSALTANMQNGANLTTTAISGSATGVTIANDITATINVNVSGAEITILTAGTQTELFHVETASTSEAYVYTYSSDFNGDIQVYKPGYKPYWLASNVFSNSNQTITVNLDEDPASQI